MRQHDVAGFQIAVRGALAMRERTLDSLFDLAAAFGDHHGSCADSASAQLFPALHPSSGGGASRVNSSAPGAGERRVVHPEKAEARAKSQGGFVATQIRLPSKNAFSLRLRLG